MGHARRQKGRDDPARRLGETGEAAAQRLRAFVRRVPLPGRQGRLAAHRQVPEKNPELLRRLGQQLPDRVVGGDAAHPACHRRFQLRPAQLASPDEVVRDEPQPVEQAGDRRLAVVGGPKKNAPPEPVAQLPRPVSIQRAARRRSHRVFRVSQGGVQLELHRPEAGSRLQMVVPLAKRGVRSVRGSACGRR